MRVVIQRVSQASVLIDNKERRNIGKGVLVLLGIENSDTLDDIEWLCGKIARLRIFGDDQGVMNLSVSDVSGEIMVISQFTLHASTKKGNRPSYIRASKPETAIPLYERFIMTLQTEIKTPVVIGEFGAYMQVSLLNDGPVTIMIDTKNKE
jgi:D-aminoacyl-tRNA deacylase